MPKIVVGVDGSEQSLAALRWAVREAELRSASLELLSAWTIPGLALASVTQEVVDALEAAAKEAIRRAVEEAAKLASAVLVVAETVEGHPARALVERARDAELLVVGARGRGEFRALLLGSVSHECAQHAAVPVVIVRERP
jgi:nucleotide-binding universal stress UspA family protein